MKGTAGPFQVWDKDTEGQGRSVEGEQSISPSRDPLGRKAEDEMLAKLGWGRELISKEEKSEADYKIVNTGKTWEREQYSSLISANWATLLGFIQWVTAITIIRWWPLTPAVFKRGRSWTKTGELIELWKLAKRRAFLLPGWINPIRRNFTGIWKTVFLLPRLFFKGSQKWPPSRKSDAENVGRVEAGFQQLAKP